MATVANPSTDADVAASFQFLRTLIAGYGPRDFAVRAWDGSMLDADAGQPTRFTIVLQHRGAIRKMFWPPNGYSLPEAYVYDDIDILGDINAFFRLANHMLALGRGERVGPVRAAALGHLIGRQAGVRERGGGGRVRHGSAFSVAARAAPTARVLAAGGAGGAGEFAPERRILRRPR